MQPALVVGGSDEFEQQVRTRERAGRLLRPFHEDQPRSGQDFVEACVKPFSIR